MFKVINPKWSLTAFIFLSLLGVFGGFSLQAQIDQSKSETGDASVVDVDPLVQPSKGAVALEGESLIAFQLAWDAVVKLERLPTEQKRDLKNYSVTFNQDKQNYYVALFPHLSLTPQKNGQVMVEIGGRNKYGPAMRYTISRKSMKITRSQSYK